MATTLIIEMIAIFSLIGALVPRGMGDDRSIADGDWRTDVRNDVVGKGRRGSLLPLMRQR